MSPGGTSPGGTSPGGTSPGGRAGYRQLVAGALAATEVTSSTSHMWFGAGSGGLPAETRRLMDAGSSRAYLLYNLQVQLYSDFYCVGEARPRLDSPMTTPLPGASPFTQALSSANAGQGAREPGWTLVGEEAGALMVRREGLTLWVGPAEIYAASDGSLAPGAPVGVLMPKELLRLSPGFYMALGDSAFPVDGSERLVRFYWNLTSAGAPALIGLLTRLLNAERLAFRVKVVSDPGQYTRCDAGVLYTLRSDYERVSAIVAEAYSAVAGALKPATPALTKQLAPGLGLAEEPGEQMVSFGMSRCRLLAEAIASAAERGIDDAEQRLEVVSERFAQEGIDLDAPYLNPGSRDDYDFPAAP
jgi:HopA1 effector protein family